MSMSQPVFTHTLTSEQLEKGCNEQFERDVKLFEKMLQEGNFVYILQEGDKFEYIQIPKVE